MTTNNFYLPKTCQAFWSIDLCSEVIKSLTLTPHGKVLKISFLARNTLFWFIFKLNLKYGLSCHLVLKWIQVLLCASNIDLDAVNLRGQRADDVAASRGHDQLAQLIRFVLTNSFHGLTNLLQLWTSFWSDLFSLLCHLTKKFSYEIHCLLRKFYGITTNVDLRNKLYQRDENKMKRKTSWLPSVTQFYKCLHLLA